LERKGSKIGKVNWLIQGFNSKGGHYYQLKVNLTQIYLLPKGLIYFTFWNGRKKVY